MSSVSLVPTCSVRNFLICKMEGRSGTSIKGETNNCETTISTVLTKEVGTKKWTRIDFPLIFNKTLKGCSFCVLPGRTVCWKAKHIRTVAVNRRRAMGLKQKAHGYSSYRKALQTPLISFYVKLGPYSKMIPSL